MKRWLWSVVHNCLIHPFMPFLPFAWMETAHEWTGARAYPPASEQDMDISHLLTQTAYVASRTGLDGNGKPAYAAARAVACRVESTQGVAKQGASGTEDASTFTLVTLEQLLPTDLVWLPGTSTSDAAAARQPGPTGVQPATPLLGGVISFYQTVL
jgi:hypothetical protein